MFRLLQVSFTATGLWSSLQRSVNEMVKRSMPGLTVVRMREALRFVVLSMFRLLLNLWTVCWSEAAACKRCFGNTECSVPNVRSSYRAPVTDYRNRLSCSRAMKWSMPGLTVSAHAWGDYSGERFVVSRQVWDAWHGIAEKIWLQRGCPMSDIRPKLISISRRNKVKCVKYICMKLPYVAQQVGNAYFYRLTEIEELSVESVMNAWGEKFTQAYHGMRAVQPCGPDGSRASLKFGVQSMITFC